ncbi:MAG: 4-hydroxy-tetrahydrodipicolinate synthase [Defluviitaleaceae bacterium]|nr:4-hydroxy-tetrahydrodipicolinate synthase [Defluviitaleaceae bacterium]
MMKKPLFKGVGTAIVTPFDKDFNIDYKVFGEHIEFLIANDVDAIIVCGTTGEAATLSYEERFNAVKFAVDKVAGRVPVLGGGGSNSTYNTIKLSQDVQKAGADGILAVTPYYNKTTQKGLVEHYKALADSVDIPILAYNVPSRTSLNIEPDTLVKIAQIDKIVGIKESSHDFVQAANMAHLLKDTGFAIYAGNDQEVLPMLSLGAVGCISVMGNVDPKTMHNICKAYENKDTDTARELQLKAMPLINALFYELNPLPVKHILNLMGFAVGTGRPPLTTLEDENIDYITKAAKDYGLI